MKQGARCLMLSVAAIWLGGCHHYLQVQDPKTGQVYYTDRWVAANGYQGPLRFTDSKGQQVNLRASRVTWIAKDDYIEATMPDQESK
jgi:hypothetical protein